VTAIGKGFRAVLATDQRGNVEAREAKTRLEAYTAARGLLALAECRKWYAGEVVSIRIEQREDHA
jgi:hypothetical protein